jgi:hypothetical protein
MIPGNEQPAVLVAELDDFRIRDVAQRLSAFISEPFWEALYGESGSGQTFSH